MKINSIQSNRLNKKGMTLIEISLVVALLLSLIAILFLGIAAYKKGVDRSKCVVIISSVQKAVRSHANMFELAIGDTLAKATIIGSGQYLESATCPSGTDLTCGDKVPAVGSAYAECKATGMDHVPSDTSGW
jgi:prepilin-type N-terminal cleavage/methylation domain-containing protein